MHKLQKVESVLIYSHVLETPAGVAAYEYQIIHENNIWQLKFKLAYPAFDKRDWETYSMSWSKEYTYDEVFKESKDIIQSKFDQLFNYL